MNSRIRSKTINRSQQMHRLRFRLTTGLSLRIQDLGASDKEQEHLRLVLASSDLPAPRARHLEEEKLK